MKNIILKWGIIGSGDVVNRLVKKSFNIKTKSLALMIMSDNLEQARVIAKKYRIRDYTDNANDIFENKDINAVYIACPPNNHFKYLIKSINSKKKYLLCEKPLVIKSSELEKLKKFLRSKKISLTTCFYRRYQKRFLKIKNIIDKKKIGKILFFKVAYLHGPETHPTAKIMKNKLLLPWRFKKKIAGAGNLFDMGSHVFDMINFLIGEISEINVNIKNIKKLYDVEDNAFIKFDLKNGVSGFGIWSSISKLNEDYFEIFGTEGKIIFSMNDNPIVKLIKPKKTHVFREKFIKPAHKPMINKIVKDFIYLKKKNKYRYNTSDLSATKHLIQAISKFKN